MPVWNPPNAVRQYLAADKISLFMSDLILYK